MDSSSFTLVNAPVSVVSMFVNFFFVFCMRFPQQGTERLKQPLNVLLGTLVGCNIILQFCIFMYVFIDFFAFGFLLYAVAGEILFLIMKTSVTSTRWLNVFYYCQIVPVQHPVFISLKRNIRVFIYLAIIAENLFFLFGFSESVAFSTFLFQLMNTTGNVTDPRMKTMKYIVEIDLWVQCGYLFICLSVMLTTSCATIRFLRKHMKSMKGNSSSSSSTIQRQMRVTITGFIQAFLFLLCLILMIAKELYKYLYKHELDMSGYISCTVFSFYSFGTTINLFVGQTIFRERGFEVWQKCLQTVTLSSK